MSQIELDLKKGEALKAEGMERIHPDQEWDSSFMEAGLELARTGEPFTAEEIITFTGYPPGSRNAIGAAMNALARELKLTRVGYQKAKRPSRHAAVVAVWQLLQ